MTTRAKNTLLDGLNEPKTLTYTVKELRQIAKDRGLKGYSKLRKQEILHLVFPTNLQTSLQTSLLDEPVPDIKTPIPQPSMFGKVWNSL